MENNKKRPLMDHWMWERPMTRAFVIVGLIIPVLVTTVLVFFFGDIGYQMLFFLGLSPVVGIVYRLMGKKINRYRDEVSSSDGIAIPAKIVQGKIEAAGIIVMGTESLTFRSIVGKSLSIPLIDLSSFKEVSKFNGSELWGKTGFWFTIPDQSKLGCAIPKSYADQFRTWLDDGINSNV